MKIQHLAEVNSYPCLSANIGTRSSVVVGSWKLGAGTTDETQPACRLSDRELEM